MNEILSQYLETEGKGFILLLPKNNEEPDGCHYKKYTGKEKFKDFDEIYIEISNEEKQNHQDILKYIPTSLGKIDLIVDKKEIKISISILEGLLQFSNNINIVLEIGGVIYKFKIKSEEKIESGGGYGSDDKHIYL